MERAPSRPHRSDRRPPSPECAMLPIPGGKPHSSSDLMRAGTSHSAREASESPIPLSCSYRPEAGPQSSSSRPVGATPGRSPRPPAPAETGAKSAVSDRSCHLDSPRTPASPPHHSSPPKPNTTPSASSRPCTPPPDRTAPRHAASKQTASPARPAAPHPSPSGSAHPLPPQPAQHPLPDPRSPPSRQPPHRLVASSGHESSPRTSPQSHAAPDTDRSSSTVAPVRRASAASRIPIGPWPITSTVSSGSRLSSSIAL